MGWIVLRRKQKCELVHRPGGESVAKEASHGIDHRQVVNCFHFILWLNLSFFANKNVLSIMNESGGGLGLAKNVCSGVVL